MVRDYFYVVYPARASCAVRKQPVDHDRADSVLQRKRFFLSQVPGQGLLPDRGLALVLLQLLLAVLLNRQDRGADILDIHVVKSELNCGSSPTDNLCHSISLSSDSFFHTECMFSVPVKLCHDFSSL